jgi:transcriptional regulator with XRE-family HTH domain
MARGTRGRATTGAMPGRRKLPSQSRTKGPQDVDRYVGARVRMQRRLMGISQEKLGHSCGITFQQIQKYESGTNRMGVSRLHQIAHLLQVPIEFFYEGAPSGAGAPMIVDQNARSMTAFLGTSEGVELVKAFMAIKGAKVRRHILDLTRAAASGKED